MKRLLQIVLLCFLATLCAAPGCKEKRKNKSKASPEETITVFFKHLNDGEFEKAKEFGTQNTSEFIDMIESYVLLGGEATSIPFQNVTCQVKGEAAVCVYCCNHQKKKESVSMVKSKGNWQVDLTKDETSALNLNPKATGSGQIPGESKDEGEFK